MLPLQKRIPFFFRQHLHLPVARFAATPSAAATPALAPFAVADYLVASCNLTRDEAVEASKALSRLKSPSNPDAVRAFLAGLGLSAPDIAAAVVRSPRLLCCNVDKTLVPRVAELRDLGLSSACISRLVLRNPTGSRLSALVSKLKYFSKLLGSSDNFLHVVTRTGCFVNCDVERVVKPNVRCLSSDWELDDVEISKIFCYMPKLLTTKTEQIQAIAERAAGIGVPPRSGMFKHALRATYLKTQEEITATMEFLKKTFQWSDAEVRLALSREPYLLNSEYKARVVAEFLISEVGLDPGYIARRPKLITSSLRCRLIPRHYVLKFLKANGLLKHDCDYFTAASRTEKVFLEKYIVPYKEAAPHLAEDYADACRGDEVPPRFRSQEPETALANI
ncbi:hypothetical protein EJB05_48963, partial [Eragrostis curvula]